MVHTRSAAPCSPAEERILRGRNFADAAATSAFITPGGAYRCAGAVAEQDPVNWTWLSTHATGAASATALIVGAAGAGNRYTRLAAHPAHTLLSLRAAGEASASAADPRGGAARTAD